MLDGKNYSLIKTPIMINLVISKPEDAILTAVSADLNAADLEKPFKELNKTLRIAGLNDISMSCSISCNGTTGAGQACNVPFV